MSTRLIVADHAKLNVFELDESRTYSYRILFLGQGHDGMILRVSNDVGGNKEAIGIGLMHVAYVDAPTVWKGGFFRTATQSECNRLRDTLGMYRPKENHDPHLGYDVDDCALFEALTPSGKFVRILASQGVEIYNSWKDLVFDPRRKPVERIKFDKDNTPVFSYVDGAGIQREFMVASLLQLLAGEHPVEAAYGIKPDDIQAALLFASELIDKTYGNDA